MLTFVWVGLRLVSQLLWLHTYSCPCPCRHLALNTPLPSFLGWFLSLGRKRWNKGTYLGLSIQQCDAVLPDHEWVSVLITVYWKEVFPLRAGSADVWIYKSLGVSLTLQILYLFNRITVVCSSLKPCHSSWLNPFHKSVYSVWILTLSLGTTE